MPGSQLCARCRASLAVHSMAFDVNPPRASDAVRRLPMPVRQFWYRQRMAVSRMISSLRGENLVEVLTRRRTIARSRTDGAGLISSPGDWLLLAVPGLVQWRYGEQTRGKIAMGVFAVLLFVGVLFAGQAIGSAAQGLMVAWHIACTVDAVQRAFDGLRDRIVVTLFSAVALVGLIYWPLSSAVGRVAMPISINMPLGDFNQGDVLIVNRIARPAPGRLVLYDQPVAQYNGTYRNLNAVYRQEGQWIGRVIAEPGQEVTTSEGKVNVPADSVLIERVGGQAPIVEGFEMPSPFVIVRKSSIVGTVYLRTHPLHRFTSL